ncbi:MAG: S53 family serine peptidase, partial [Candidatus Dormibacteraeota bacterium]|nr:S53 family serine peptidase [Candidatus Dormibacteraeota bacterium]
MAIGLFAASAVPALAASPARANLARSDSTPGLQHADKLHRADPRRQLSIGVSLALRNEAQLEAFIAQVSDRKSPNYGHYLTPGQFAASYGPTQTQVQEVVDHLRTSGLTVGSVSSNRTIVDATGPVSAVETAFGVTISDWHDRELNRDFFGNETEPTLPAAVASYVVGVAGLNNHYRLHRLGPGPRVGGGPAGGYTPNELKKAYDVTPLASAGYTGSGQRLGLMELDGFQQNNINAYDTQYGLGSPPPTTVVVPPGPGALDINGGEIEVELDIEVMHAIAPASPITVWEGQNSDQGVNDTYNAIVTSNTTKSNSTSWGICEPNTTQAEMTILDNIFKQAAAQGQSFYAASGDNGAYDCRYSRQLAVDSPANDPYITGTGGTNLTLNTDSTYKTESAWSNRGTSPATGTGGGLSSYFARPSWQTGPGVANTYSNGKRQVPDVSLDADPQTGYSVYVTYNGSTGWNVVGGTSAAAPAWAAFTGVYNQYAAAYGKPNLGYANPTLYSTASNGQA